MKEVEEEVMDNFDEPFSIEDLKDIPGFEEETTEEPVDSQEQEEEKQEEQEEEKVKEPKKKSKKTEEEEFEDKVNKELDEELGIEEPTKKKGKKNEEEGFSYAKAIQMLREQNLISYDDPEEGEEPWNEEEALEILRDSIEDKIEDGIEDKMKGLSPLMKTLLKYELDGGDPTVLLDQLNKQSTSAITADMDMDEESNQKLVVRETLREEGYDDDYINTQLEFLEDSGKLKMIAKKKYSKWEQENKYAYEQEIKRQEAEKRRREDAARQYRSDLNKYINETDNIGGLTLNKQDKKTLTSYLTDRVVKTQNAANITNFHADLGEVLQNREASIQLAKLLRSRDKNGLFTFDAIKKEVETKVTNTVRDGLRRNRDKSIPSGRGRGEQKSLADYF